MEGVKLALNLDEENIRMFKSIDLRGLDKENKILLNDIAFLIKGGTGIARGKGRRSGKVIPSLSRAIPKEVHDKKIRRSFFLSADHFLFFSKNREPIPCPP